VSAGCEIAHVALTDDGRGVLASDVTLIPGEKGAPGQKNIFNIPKPESMILKSCRLFRQDYASKQKLRAQSISRFGELA